MNPTRTLGISGLVWAAGVAVSSIAPAAFAAAEHGAAEASPASLLLPVINFALFVFVFVRYAWPVIKTALAERRQLVEKELAEAERAITEAQALLGDIEARRARLHDEGRRLTDDLRAEGERERQALVEAARQSAERIRVDGRAVGAQEAARAAKEIREEIAERAIDDVTAKLRSRLRPADQDRFVADFLTSVESGAVK